MPFKTYLGIKVPNILKEKKKILSEDICKDFSIVLPPIEKTKLQQKMFKKTFQIMFWNSLIWNSKSEENIILHYVWQT